MTVAGGPGDLGADITCRTPKGERAIVQCKQYAVGRTVGSREIQSFIGMAFTHHRADAAVYVTTATYTASARELAKRHAIELVDGDRLSELLLEHCAEEESDDAIVANTFAIAASGLLTSGEVLEIAPDATASVVAIGAPRECSCGAQMEWHNDRAPRWDSSTCGEVIGRSDVAVDDPPGSKAFNDFVIALNAGDFLRAAEMFAVNAAVTSLSGPVTALRTPTDAERWVATFPVILDPVVAYEASGIVNLHVTCDAFDRFSGVAIGRVNAMVGVVEGRITALYTNGAR